MFRIKRGLNEAGIGKDRFFIRDDLSVCIDDGVCDIVDFQRFSRNEMVLTINNIKQAEKVIGSLNGELFTEIDAFWVIEKREWVMSQAEELLINVATFYLSEDYKEQAEKTLLRLLSLNPISEQGFNRLLDMYIHTGDIIKYRGCYERYREMLKKEYNMRPPKNYFNYYENCMGKLKNFI